MTTGSSERLARWLLAVVTFLIVYGSLYPFHFVGAGAGSLVELLGRLHWARTTRSDIAANVLLYLPFGACIGWILAVRLGGPLAVLATVTIGVLLSTSIELAQVLETRRVASLSDVFFNGAGALAGSALALALRYARHGYRRHAFSSLLAEPIAAALLFLWIGYRLAPFALTLDPAQWWAAVMALVDGPWIAPAETLRYLVPWLVAGQALRRLRGGGNAVPALAGMMLLVLGGMVLVAGRSPVAAEVLAMPLALVLTWPLARLPEARGALLLAGLLAATLLLAGLVPFNFQVDPDAFAMVPFRDALTRYRAANLPDMFEKCFSYGALVWLLARARLGTVAATLAAGGLVFGIELLQVWLPGRMAEITDPLLVVAAGGLIAVFDEPAAGRAGSSRRWR